MSRPRGALRTALALAVGVAAVLLVAGLSRVRYTAHADPDALLRLSWRIRGEAVEACRAPTAEEVEELPVHMRNPEACQQRGRAYRLRVWTDGDLLVDRVVAPSGARVDRPVYVFQEATLPPGSHELQVTFDPVEEPEDASRDEPRERTRGTLRYQGTVEMEAGEVVLVTVGTDGGSRDRLEARTSLR